MAANKPVSGESLLLVAFVVLFVWCEFSGSFTQAFSESFTHHFHDHAPTIFSIMHPPWGSSLLAVCSSLAIAVAGQLPLMGLAITASVPGNSDLPPVISPTSF
jgi:hypothetical protein